MAKIQQPPKVNESRFDDWLFLFWKSVTDTVVGTTTPIGTTQVSGGGTGSTNLTGYLKGNGTSPFTTVSKIPYSDITGTPIISGDQPPVTALNQNAGTGLYALTAYGASATRTITGTASRLTVTNGDGVAANPTVDISAGYVGQATITTVGTISSGIWNAGQVTSSATVTGTQLISTITTGTAPISVTSTTLVPNLNVTKLLGFDWQTPGSIGLTAPNAAKVTTFNATGQSSIGGTVNAESLLVKVTPSAVNHITIAGAVATSAPGISAEGTDTNLDLNLVPKGTGIVKVFGDLQTNNLTTVSGGTIGGFAGRGSLLFFTGNVGTTGYFAFISSGGVRQGYIGFSSSTAAVDSGDIPYVAVTHSFVGKIISDRAIRTGGFTVAALPVGVLGDRAHVTDSLAPTFLAAVVGGGAVKTPVFYNGTAWVAG